MANSDRNDGRALSESELESIERIVLACGDDLAIAIDRSSERLEERLDAAETRLFSRLRDIEDSIIQIHERAPL